jgi:diguanylate cyclase (GGDEF)-like protein
LAEQMAHARWTGRPFSLGLIDLDGCHRFKGLTHAAQSDALARVAAIIGEYVTAGDLVGRVGPQALAVLLPERDSTDALTLVQYLGQRGRIATLDMGPNKEPLRLDPAVAVVTYVNDGLNVEGLLLVANSALGRARAEHDKHCGAARPPLAVQPQPRAANAPLWTYPPVPQAAATSEQPHA